jgi:uncharacterized protein
MNLVESHIDQITRLCKTHAVDKLFVFGSVLTNKFSSSSDVDLLVNFKPIDHSKYADNYFDLKFSLEKIFHRPVDLLEEKAIRNPFLKRSIDSTKKLIYG